MPAAEAQFATDDRFPFLEERQRQWQQNQQRMLQDRQRRDGATRQPGGGFSPGGGGGGGSFTPGRGGGGGGGAAEADFATAPAGPANPAEPKSTVLVIGDSLADWLGYGLQYAFADDGDVAITRRVRAWSSLARPDSYDWSVEARRIVTAEKADFIVIMVGLSDRQSIREGGTPVRRRQSTPATPVTPAPPPAAATPSPPAAAPASPVTLPGATTPTPVQPPPAAVVPTPEPAVTPVVWHEFRTPRWDELYGDRIEQIARIARERGVPVFWVAQPAMRGNRTSVEVRHLNTILKARAEKAGVLFVDPWDGFVDEQGEFAATGPDIDGQTRRLRTGDGLHFTRPGARKLAHYVEREIRKILAARMQPMEMPAMPPPTAPPPADPPPVSGAPPAATPPVAALPAAPPQPPPGPPPRPAAGPVVPLTVAGAPGEAAGLVGDRNAPARPAPEPESAAARVILRGEAVPSSVPGRADDYRWPR